MPKDNPNAHHFNRAWFRRYQKVLVMLLNNPATKDMMRWILRIHHFDCLPSERIIAIMPNRYTVLLEHQGDRVLLRTDFRTHWKYSKRMYEAFKVFWWAFHAWDMGIANRLNPAWNLGFDTLTAYPDAHTESTTVDGFVADISNDKTWSDMQDEPGSFYHDNDTDVVMTKIAASTTTNQWAEIYRSIFLFDTSALTTDATISAAVMSLYANSGGITYLTATNDICIYSSAPASNTALAAGDFDSLGTTEFSNVVSEATWVASAAYKDFTFNATGRAAVSKTGVSKFGARNHTHDAHNSAPTWASAGTLYLNGAYSDSAGTSKDPRLVVTYTLPASAVLQNPLNLGGGVM